MTVEASVVVISPTSKSNALGRAIALADLARDVFDDVLLYAPDDGVFWQGESRSMLPVRRFESSREILAQLHRLDGRVLVWAIKPMPGSWGSAGAIKRALPSVLAILDLDDADEALSRQFMAASPVNRLRLHPWSALHPRRIRNTLELALSEADGVTHATDALIGALGIEYRGPMLRVPHPRRLDVTRFPAKPSPGGRVDIGFLGTVREHKGIADIQALLLADPRYRLHVFRGALAPKLTGRIDAAQLVEHEPDAPMEQVYGEIDVVVLPQDRSPGARAQLPAKLLDAMRFAKPVIASPSAAIMEAAGGTVLYVADWGSTSEVQQRIKQAVAEGQALGESARARFEQRLALETQRATLTKFVASVCAVEDFHHVAEVS
jgi:glycosyltransferase involved in cell wall biosynthesis